MKNTTPRNRLNSLESMSSNCFCVLTVFQHTFIFLLTLKTVVKKQLNKSSTKPHYVLANRAELVRSRKIIRVVVFPILLATGVEQQNS